MSLYNPESIESSGKNIDEHRSFVAEQDSKTQVLCVVYVPIPPGSGLHVGHPLSYTAVLATKNERL